MCENVKTCATLQHCFSSHPVPLEPRERVHGCAFGLVWGQAGSGGAQGECALGVNATTRGEFAPREPACAHTRPNAQPCTLTLGSSVRGQALAPPTLETGGILEATGICGMISPVQ